MDPEELLSIAAQADFEAESAFAEEVWTFYGDGTVTIPERNGAASTLVRIDGDEEGEENHDDYPCSNRSVEVSSTPHEDANPVELQDMHQSLIPVDTRPSSSDTRLSPLRDDDHSRMQDVGSSTITSPTAEVRSSSRRAHANAFHPYPMRRPVTPRSRDQQNRDRIDVTDHSMGAERDDPTSDL